MITKYGISPWTDNQQQNIHLQQKSIAIPKTEPLKPKQNKLLKLSQRYLTENQFIVVRKKNKKKFSEFKLPSQSLSKSTDNSDFVQRIQMSTININKKMKKKMSTQLFNPSTKIQVNLSSQRKNSRISNSIYVHQKQVQQKKHLSQNQIPVNHQSMPYFFSLIQKQSIKYNKQKNIGQQRNHRINDNQIFKKVDQIIIKRKKLIKLPKISVACSQQYL